MKKCTTPTRKLPQGVKAAISRSGESNSRYGVNSPMGSQGVQATRPITLPNADAFAKLGSTLKDADR